MALPNIVAFFSSPTGFSFTVRFGAGVTPTLRDIFAEAAARWLAIVTNALPPVIVDGMSITGVFIDTLIGTTSGGGAYNAETVFNQLRPSGTGATASLPAHATITLDQARLGQTVVDAETNTPKRLYLLNVVTHELGHALGFSKDVWTLKGVYLPNTATDTPVFTPRRAGDLRRPGQ